MGIVRDRTAQAVMDEAAEWMVRLGSPDVSTGERAAFVAWLRRSPAHLAEYLNAERMWADLAAVDRQRRFDVAALLARDEPGVVSFNSAQRARPARAALSYGRVAAAASVVVCAIAAVWYLHVRPAAIYSTAVGEQRTLKLADGSVIALNTATRVRVDFSPAAREVHLLEGEALFRVGKDPARPFRVLSGHAVAQALGTAFVVRKESAATVVKVIEGQVAVARLASGREWPSAGVPPQAVRLSAGARADVARADIQTSTLPNPDAATAWQSRRLIFSGETLTEAVAEFNRYNTLQLVLRDSSLSRERLSGVFDADQPQSLAKFLERSGLIETPRADGDTLVLAPR